MEMEELRYQVHALQVQLARYEGAQQDHG